VDNTQQHDGDYGDSHVKALLIRQDLIPALQSLKDDELGQLMRRAMALVVDDTDDKPPENQSLLFAWTVLREKVIENGMRYDSECTRRAEHARTAALARHSKNEQQQFGFTKKQNRS
jgi:hypothetical protein